MPLPGHQDISLSQILRIITTSGIERAISGFSEDNQVKRFNDNNHWLSSENPLIALSIPLVVIILNICDNEIS
jgi:hypothetical protein